MGCPHSVSHRKQPSRVAQCLLAELATFWTGLNPIQRQQKIMELIVNGCTQRTIADAISKDEGTIRNCLKVRNLPPSAMERLASGSPLTPEIRACRIPQFRARAGQRLERERLDGTPSDNLADRIAWFLTRELPAFCMQPSLDELFWWAERNLYERVKPMLRNPSARRLPEPVSPDYPVGHVIRMARPTIERDMLEFEYALEWLEDFVLLVENVKEIREAGLKKALAMLRIAAVNTAESTQSAAQSNPKAFGEYLRQLKEPAWSLPSSWS